MATANESSLHEKISEPPKDFSLVLGGPLYQLLRKSRLSDNGLNLLKRRLIVTVLPYRFGFGLPHEQKIVLSLGMATRNLGAAFAPLVAAPFIDKRATVMVVLGIPLMVLFAAAAAKWFKPPAPDNASE